MLQRFAGIGRLASRGHGTSQIWPSLTSSIVSSDAFEPCSCSTHQVCRIHGTGAALANPDNKPAPPGKDSNDPTNVKHDTPTKDPDDSPDWAPGYYDGKGGGHRRVASQEESKQVPDRYPGGEPPDDDPRKGQDPNLPDEEDPNKPKIPEYEGSLKAQHGQDPDKDPQNPNKEPLTAGGRLPDQNSGLAGMPPPQAPPQAQETSGAEPSQQAGARDATSPFGDPSNLDDFENRAEKLMKEGRVKPGKP